MRAPPPARAAGDRQAIEDLEIRYVFLGNGFIRKDYTRLPGLEGVAASPSLRLVHQEPGVRVFEVDLVEAPTEPVPACTPPGEPNPSTDGGSG